MDSVEMEKHFTSIECNLNTVEFHLQGADIDDRHIDHMSIPAGSRVRMAESNYGTVVQEGYAPVVTEKDLKKLQKKEDEWRRKQELKPPHKRRPLRRHFDSQIQVHVDKVYRPGVLKVKCFRKGTLNLPGSSDSDMSDIERPLQDIIAFLEKHSFYIRVSDLMQGLDVPRSQYGKLFECGEFLLERVHEHVSANVLAKMRRRKDSKTKKLDMESAREMSGVDLTTERFLEGRVWKNEVRHYICSPGGVYPCADWESVLKDYFVQSTVSVRSSHSVLMNFDYRMKLGDYEQLNVKKLDEILLHYRDVEGPLWRRSICEKYERLGAGREFSHSLMKFLPPNPIWLTQLNLEPAKSNVKFILKFFRGKKYRPTQQGDITVKIFNSSSINIDSTQARERAMAVYNWLGKIIIDNLENLIEESPKKRVPRRKKKRRDRTIPVQAQVLSPDEK